MELWGNERAIVPNKHSIKARSRGAPEHLEWVSESSRTSEGWCVGQGQSQGTVTCRRPEFRSVRTMGEC